MDIRLDAAWPANKVSNLAGNGFTLDGVACASMEGFLQGLKFSSPEMQAMVSTYIGKKAKRTGARKNWRRRQTLYWRGVPIDRHSRAYQDLLDRAYDAMAAQSESFRSALLATGDAVLRHSLGKSNPKDTVLTEREFVSRLHAIRARLLQARRRTSR